MSLSEARFHDLVDETQEKLEDIFDESDLDIDLESSAGVLTVKFENGSQLIFSRQEPLRQLWLAAVSGGFHSTTTKKASAGCATRAKSSWAKCFSASSSSRLAPNSISKVCDS